MIRYRISHRTRFTYTVRVTLCHNVAHLLPRECPWQVCERSDLVVTPTPAVRDDRRDFFGNVASHFEVQEAHQVLTVQATHQVVVRPRSHPPETPRWEAVRDGPSPDSIQFVLPSRYVPHAAELRDFAAPSFDAGRPVLDAALDLTHRIFRDFQYDPQSTTVSTPVREVFDRRRGVCQDFAHLQIACLRSLGLPARYVSGYLSTGPRLVGSDASHAWVSVFCGPAGWIDLDPTNDQMVNQQHIQTAWGRDYDDVSPVKGVVLGGGRHSVDVSVEAAVLDENVKDVPREAELGPETASSRG